MVKKRIETYCFALLFILQYDIINYVPNRFDLDHIKNPFLTPVLPSWFVNIIITKKKGISDTKNESTTNLSLVLVWF